MPLPVRIALSLLLITFFTLPLSFTASAQVALPLSEDFEDQTDGGEGGNDESLTRSPDFTGDFVQDSTAAGALMADPRYRPSM